MQTTKTTTDPTAKRFRWLLIAAIVLVLGVAVFWIFTVRTQQRILEQDDHERVPYYEDTPR